MPSEEFVISFARLTVFLLMFLNGAKIPLRVFSMHSRRALLVRGALAALVLVPLSTLLILGCVDLPVNVASALALPPALIPDNSMLRLNCAACSSASHNIC